MLQSDVRDRLPKKLCTSIAHLARQHSAECINKLQQLMNCGELDIELKATQLLMERGWGKPVPADEMADESPATDLSDKTTEELLQLADDTEH